MATYKEIFGTKVKNYTTNPSNPVEGELWYNDTDNELKLQTFPGATGIWVTSAELNNGRDQGCGSGTQDAAIVWGGTPVLQTTELYNGTAWTEVNDLNQGGPHRVPSNHGPQTATLASAGFGSTDSLANVELWNGSSWTETTDLNAARTKTSGAGISTSALVMGGPGPATSPNDAKIVESWNGSAWTEIADTANNGISSGAGGASNTSAVVYGCSPGDGTRTEVWNGSSWTEVADMNTGKFQIPSHGIATAALRIGGRTPDSGDTDCERWNGTAWTNVAALNSLANFAAGAGTSSLGLRAMGPGGGNNAVSEEFYWSDQTFAKPIT